MLLPYRNAKKVRGYEEAAKAAGIEPISVLAEGTIRFEDAGGLFLIGGSDVNSKRYGEPPVPETDTPDDPRDQVEFNLIAEAIERDLPIFAICRGLQMLNVFHGGSLIQHLPNCQHHDPDPSDSNTAAPAHKIAIESGTLLSDIAGESSWEVNSRHHQAVKELGRHLIVSARDPEDGTIEALERPDRHFVVAVQWHPEDQVRADSKQLKLFQRFAHALR